MARKRIVILASVVLLSAPSMAAPEPGPAAVAELGRLVPAHHALQTFAGSATWYKPRSAPLFRFEQPDFDAWAATLEETAVDPTASEFVAIWRDAENVIRYVLAKGDQPRLFTVDGDYVEFEDPGFQTQVGVARWGWVYSDGLLRTHRTWRLAVEQGEDGQPTGAVVPSALFVVTTYEYRHAAVVPFHSRTYWSEEDLQAGRWGQKTWYEPDGRHKRTKHNKERPYPY